MITIGSLLEAVGKIQIISVLYHTTVSIEVNLHMEVTL